MTAPSAEAARARQGSPFAIKTFLPRYALILVFGAVVIAATAMFPQFIAWTNLKAIFCQSLLLCIISSSMTMVLLVGGIDMSLGASASLCAALCVGFINSHVPTPLACLLAMLAGVACEALNVTLIVFAGLPGFLATISTMFIFGGVELAYTKGFNLILSQQAITTWVNGTLLGIPISFLVLALVFGLLYFLTRHTRVGLRMYTTGANRIFAAQSGVSLRKYTVIGYLLAGALAGLSGVILAARLSAHVPMAAGVPMLLDAFIAAFLGSTLFGRGEFNLPGSLVGGLFMGVLVNVFAIVGIPVSYINLVKGIILIVAVSSTSRGKRLIGQVTL